MNCEECGKKPATIHLTQIVDDTVTTVHLCESCAAERGVPSEGSVAKYPLTDFLASISMGKAGSALPAGEPSAACTACGATLQDFRESGRLGCPKCYDSFARHLRDLLRRLHGSSLHVGRQYLGGRAAQPDDEPTLDELREQLRRAVAEERFELAAEIRDRIKVLE